ncbi:unnamed protein product [Boreogadus saida]
MVQLVALSLEVFLKLQRMKYTESPHPAPTPRQPLVGLAALVVTSVTFSGLWEIKGYAEMEMNQSEGKKESQCCRERTGRFEFRGLGWGRRSASGKAVSHREGGQPQGRRSATGKAVSHRADVIGFSRWSVVGKRFLFFAMQTS